jgi:3-oxoacyl-[acyl-carrier-protein] synthase-3
VEYALVIGADVLARTCDPTDRGTIIIFGDGAGAVVLGSPKSRVSSPRICMLMAATANC